MTMLFEVQERLNADELVELSTHESVIERGLRTFQEVGTALLAIRDGRLYREVYGTFEDYCKDRWQMSSRHANRTIEAAQVAGNLGPIGPIPTAESQARPLTRLEPDAQRQAWQEAIDTAPNGKVTGAHVAKVVERYMQPESVDEYEELADELEEDEDAYTWSEPEPVAPVAPSKMAVHYSSETPEHYTPREIIDAVIDCMGVIDLDPCSNSHDAPNVPARYHFTQDDDGLAQMWLGKVYMNPPYGREISEWVEKLVRSHESGEVEEAIALVPARTDTKWWAMLRDYPVCFVQGRLKFGNAETGAPFPSAVFYLGNEIDKFYHSFCGIGDIWQRIEPGMFGE